MCTFIGAGIKSKQSTSVVNILRNLVESNIAEVYIPDNYVGESKYTTDSRVHFIDAPVRVYDLVGNQERFNVSLKADVPVIVDTDNGQRRKKVFRNYTVVRDGVLNLTDINVRFLERDFFESYKSVNLVDGEYELNKLYTIHLADVPVVSCDWAKPNQYGLVDMLKEDAQLSETLKVIRKEVKVLKESYVESFTESDYYTKCTTGIIAISVPSNAYYVRLQCEITALPIAQAGQYKKSFLNEELPNKPTLDKFSEQNGNLLWDGSLIESGLSAVVTDLPVSDGTDIQSGYAYIDSTDRTIKVKA